MSKAKNVNYTPEDVQTLRDHAPLDKEKAEMLAEKLGKTARSIIAKANREGIEYIKQAAPEKKRTTPKKEDMVKAIAYNLALYDAALLSGLEKSPVKTLATLMDSTAGGITEYTDEVVHDSE